MGFGLRQAAAAAASDRPDGRRRRLRPCRPRRRTAAHPRRPHFAENAFLKANAAYLKTGLPAVADDSGLCVDAIDGRPGVYTARYGGEGLTDEERYIKLLDEMKNVDDDKRSAHFTSSICCIVPDGSKITAEGICEGKIGYEPIGKDGFGYDPIFMFGDKSFAELSAEEKDAVSHRGKALTELKAKLENYFKNN